MSDTPETDAARIVYGGFQFEQETDSVSVAFARGLERQRNAALAEVARLKAGGCARDQRTTQFCAEAVELQKQLAEARECLREAAGILSCRVVYSHNWHTCLCSRCLRWRKAAGVDGGNPNSIGEKAAGESDHV